MTELATMAQTRPPTALPSSDALARLGEWVNAASQAHQLVAPLVSSAFVPDGFKPKIERGDDADTIAAKTQTAVANATAAVLLGLGIGVDPLTALQQIIVIKGRPGMYAKFKVALLRSRGFDIWEDELTDETCTVSGCRPGDGRVHTVTITMAMAKRAGWTSNDAYAKTPSDMLWARAVGRLCDRIGGDVLLGIPTAEDNHDEQEPTRVDAQVGRVTAEAILAGDDTSSTKASPPPVDGPGPAKRTRKAAASRASSAKTDADITDPGANDVARGVDPDAIPANRIGDPDRVPNTDAPTPEAMRRMFAALKAAGIDDREAALGFIRQQIGRTVESRAELTASEVATVIDALEDPTVDEEATA